MLVENQIHRKTWEELVFMKIPEWLGLPFRHNPSIGYLKFAGNRSKNKLVLENAIAWTQWSCSLLVMGC